MLTTTSLIYIAIGTIIGGLIFNARFRRKVLMGIRDMLSSKGGTVRKESEHRDYQREGSRRREHSYIVTCDQCNGIGKIPKRMPKIADTELFGHPMITCPKCQGKKEITVYD